MLSARLLFVLTALFMGTTHAAHTYRATTVHAAAGEAVVARSPLPQHEANVSQRAEMALTLPRFDIGLGGGGDSAVLNNNHKRDALNANVGLMAPTGMIKVGGKMHRMLIIPSYPQTVFTPEANYSGGNKTPYKDTLKQQDNTTVTDTIYLDSILFGGVTALNVAIGSSSAPVPTLTGESIHAFGADGVLGFTPDSNPAGYSARVSKTLKGYASSLGRGEVLTISLDPGYSVGGKATIGRRKPKFTMRTAYSDQWAAPAGVHINGFALAKPATVDVGSPFIYVPLATAEAIFKKAGLKTRTVPWRGSTVLEGVLDDCQRGFSMVIRFGGGGDDDAATVVVAGASGAFKDPKKQTMKEGCVAALRGSPEGDHVIGWPLFRAARGGVSYNAETLEIGIDA